MVDEIVLCQECYRLSAFPQPLVHVMVGIFREVNQADSCLPYSSTGGNNAKQQSMRQATQDLGSATICLLISLLSQPAALVGWFTIIIGKKRSIFNSFCKAQILATIKDEWVFFKQDRQYVPASCSRPPPLGMAVIFRQAIYCWLSDVDK